MLCTFAKTGHKHEKQRMSVCYTCWPFATTDAICMACANFCHFGHRLEEVSWKEGFCDCGAEGRCGNRNPFCGGVAQDPVLATKKAPSFSPSSSSSSLFGSKQSETFGSKDLLFGPKQSEALFGSKEDLLFGPKLSEGAFAAKEETRAQRWLEAPFKQEFLSVAAKGPLLGWLASNTSVPALQLAQWCEIAIALCGQNSEVLSFVNLWMLTATLAQAASHDAKKQLDACKCFSHDTKQSAKDMDALNAALASSGLQSHTFLCTRMPVKPTFAKENKSVICLSLDSVEKINAIIAKGTGNLITHALHEKDVDSATTHVFLSTLYFKGRWERAFNTRDTCEGLFKGVPMRQLPLMHSSDQTFRYLETQTAQWLEIVTVSPQKQFVMGFCLAKDHAKELQIPAAAAFSERKLSEVVIPKFKVTTRLNLKPWFSQTGFSALFAPSLDNKARWDKITDSNVFISNIVHMATIEIDEVGVTAAAASFAMASFSMPLNPDPSFIATRPFSFYLRDLSGLVAFQGRFA